MTTPEPPFSEHDLNSYIDDQLDPERRVAVERYLTANRDAARRVGTDIAHCTALRAAFAGQMTQPLPPELNPSRIVEQRLCRRWVSWQIAASVVLTLGIGAAGGWLLHMPGAPELPALAMEVLQQEALAGHTAYGADSRRPVEMTAANRDQLAQWLSTRLNHHIMPPDLSGYGYTLIGGRSFATALGGTATLLIYEDKAGNRMSLLMRPMTTDLRVPIVDWDRDEVNACSWIRDGIGYALLGKVPDDQLDRIARDISGPWG